MRSLLDSSPLLRKPLVVVENDGPELPAEKPVHEGVDHRIAVADPQDGCVQHGRGGQLQKARQRHPDEEGQPADEEDTDHDAHRGGGTVREKTS